jgi:Family of unknown function (DUF6527)
MKHQFVEFVPETLEPETVYVSIEHDIAIHLCACGCKNQVVTPLSPAGWSVTYDGRSISLSPSIGNWNFECKSHYFIRKGRIDWSRKFSRDEIEWVQHRDAKDRDDLFDKDGVPAIDTVVETKGSKGFWGWWSSLLR